MRNGGFGLLAVCFCAFSMPSDTSWGQQGVITPRIINGTPTSDFDSVGLVGTVELGSFCSGTLIGPRHVLTAAHCAVLAEGPTDGTFEVNGQVYVTSQVYVHRRYNSRTMANDIAIYELSEEVQGVTPSPIFRGTPRVGQVLTLVGFGSGGDGDTGQDGTFGEKKVGTTPIDEVERTRIIWRFDDNTESNTSFGDSGGPAFLEVDGQFYVAGVTSGGSEPDSKIGDVSFDTRVDAYANWIDSIVGAADEPGDDPGGDPGDDPGGDPGGDPGSDPGSEPGGEPGGEPTDDDDNEPCPQKPGNKPGHGPGPWYHPGQGPHQGGFKPPWHGSPLPGVKPPSHSPWVGGLRQLGQNLWSAVLDYMNLGAVLAPPSAQHASKPPMKSGSRQVKTVTRTVGTRRVNSPSRSATKPAPGFGAANKAFGGRVKRTQITPQRPRAVVPPRKPAGRSATPPGRTGRRLR